jgi:hypothetical protein
MLYRRENIEMVWSERKKDVQVNAKDINVNIYKGGQV